MYEAELVRKAIAGDTRATGQLLVSHYQELVRVATTKIPDELKSIADPEDIVHEALVSACQKLHQFDTTQRGSFGAWLRTILDNSAVDFIRRQKRKKRGGNLRRAQRENCNPSVEDLLQILAGNDGTASREAMGEEAKQAVRDAIEKLSESHREVIELFYFRQLKAREVSELLGEQTTAVLNRRARALKKLQQLVVESAIFPIRSS